jgi:hypothetical protein
MTRRGFLGSSSIAARMRETCTSMDRSADLPADVQAVGIRQHQVEDDDVHRLSPMQREAARSVFGVNDLKARLAEILAYHFGKTGIIFDQEDAVAHDCPSTGFHHW